jgi:hypothetical protein
MKRLAAVALLLFAACDKEPSKLDGIKSTAPGVALKGGAPSAESEAALAALSDRVKALEDAHLPGAHLPGGQADATLADRMHSVETTIMRYQEALEFLNKVYAQQKQQQEQQEASEPDPTAVFAVDISGPLKAGQVEGPNSAMITIVEAWDFA